VMGVSFTVPKLRIRHGVDAVCLQIRCRSRKWRKVCLLTDITLGKADFNGYGSLGQDPAVFHRMPIHEGGVGEWNSDFLGFTGI